MKGPPPSIPKRRERSRPEWDAAADSQVASGTNFLSYPEMIMWGSVLLEVPLCEAPGCDREVYARGHCSRHYKQLLRHGEVQPDRAPVACAVETCDRRAVTRGWCHGHYLRWPRQGELKEDV